jgi:hypothetical protein
MTMRSDPSQMLLKSWLRIVTAALLASGTLASQKA